MENIKKIQRMDMESSIKWIENIIMEGNKRNQCTERESSAGNRSTQMDSYINENQSDANSSEQVLSVGEIIWAKVNGCKWWPAILINPTYIGQAPARIGYLWVFWFADYNVSQVSKKKTCNFVSFYQEMNKIISGKRRHRAIKEVLEILAGVAGHSYDSNDHLFAWAESGFKNLQVDANHFSNSLPPLVTRHLNYVNASEDQENSDQSDSENFKTCIKKIHSGELKIEDFKTCLKKIHSGELKIEEICIACRRSKAEFQHPFFNGGLCESCQDEIKETAFAMGSDGKNICCIICAQPGSLVFCENVNCPKSFCLKCMNIFWGPVAVKQILKASPWKCFFCCTRGIDTGLLKVNNDWEKSIFSIFTRKSFISDLVPLSNFYCKRPITVLSIFDDIGTGKLVLDMLGIHVDKYYSSEIDEDAIKVSKFHHKDSIIHLGDVRSITEGMIQSLGKIDLLIGGLFSHDLSVIYNKIENPCDFNKIVGRFFDFFNLLTFIQSKNRDVFYLFRNVESMPDTDRDSVSACLASQPALIDAKYFSPLARPSYFWGNIPGLSSLPKFWNSTNVSNENSLSECIAFNVGRIAVVDKVELKTKKQNVEAEDIKPVIMDGKPDDLWITELEKVFGFPAHYTDIGNLSIAKRKKLLERAISVSVMKTILRPLRSFFTCE